MSNKLKPNLIDPILNQKIIKTLKPNIPDYWEPTKKSCNTFYQKYIKPNLKFIVILILLLLVLLYRYRSIKNRRINKTKNINANNDFASYFIDTYSKEKEESRDKNIKKKLRSNI